MKSISRAISVLFISLLTACASIPPESVDLSTEVGIGIKKQYQSQIDLVNVIFSEKRKALDLALTQSLKKYFDTLTPAGTIELNRDQLADVAQDVLELNQKNTAAKEELEKARLLIVKKLNENYTSLNVANSSVTGILQSAVTVKEARSEAFKALSKATDGKIDLDKVYTELDNFILKGGEEAGKGIKLADTVKSLLDNSKEENKQ